MVTAPADRAADEAAITDLVRLFFAAFTSGPGSAERLDALPRLFLPDAVIVRTCGGEPTVYGVDSFIAPRRDLLGGALVDFSEWELRGHTELFGDIAQHFGGYAKAGVLDGSPFTGQGMKSMQFVRTTAGWRISAVAWDDERDGLAVAPEWSATIDRVRTFAEYEIDDDPARLDHNAIWTFLSSEAYWARHRDRDTVERQIAAAWRVVGVYTAQGEQIAFARAESDGIANAYLTDVYVTAPHRGRGVGAALIEEMIEHGPAAALRWMLHTVDGHGFYRRLGFERPDLRFLEREPRATQDDPWDREVAAVWTSGADEDEIVARIEALAAQDPDSARAQFELASAYDHAGREADAEPRYRRAVAMGLDEDRQARASVQLASTLRNLGRPADALDVLAGDDSMRLATDRAAFAALALLDAGRPDEAVATALEALAPLLRRYGRAVSYYAGELRTRAVQSSDS